MRPSGSRRRLISRSLASCSVPMADDGSALGLKLKNRRPVEKGGAQCPGRPYARGCAARCPGSRECRGRGRGTRRPPRSGRQRAPWDGPTRRRGGGYSRRSGYTRSGRVRLGARSSTDRASDYGSEGWEFESLRARSYQGCPPPGPLRVGPDAMTVCAPDVALLDLTSDAGQAVATAGKDGHCNGLVARIAMIKLQGPDVGLATIDARMLRKVDEQPSPHLLDHSEASEARLVDVVLPVASIMLTHGGSAAVTTPSSSCRKVRTGPGLTASSAASLFL
jgi:hypothetical protein